MLTDITTRTVQVFDVVVSSVAVDFKLDVDITKVNKRVIATLANIALIIPFSSASCERRFSCQNRIKMGLRKTLRVKFRESDEVAIKGALLAEFDLESKVDL